MVRFSKSGLLISHINDAYTQDGSDQQSDQNVQNRPAQACAACFLTRQLDVLMALFVLNPFHGSSPSFALGQKL